MLRNVVDSVTSILKTSAGETRGQRAAQVKPLEGRKNIESSNRNEARLMCSSRSEVSSQAKVR